MANTSVQATMNELSRVLTARGYAIRKDRLEPEKQQFIRSSLTVAPKSLAKTGPSGKPFAVYYESPLRFYLPRHWAREHFGPEEADALPEGNSLPSNIKFTGKPYDYQEAILN